MVKKYEDNDIWYEVAGVKFLNKFAAIDAADGDLNGVQLNFMTNTWNSVNFTTEPEESWQELAKRRCLQLREKYSHLALWYSSGYDSHTILRTFVENKILLDEIIILNRRKLWFDPELDFAVANAKKVKEVFPNLQITVIEVEDCVIDFYKMYGENWIYNTIGGQTKFLKTLKYYIVDLYPQTFKRLGGLKGKANITGSDKVKVNLYDNKWYMFFMDVDLAENTGVTNLEKFYISEDLPQLHVKQAWNAIRWFESLPNLSHDLVHAIQGKEKVRGGAFEKYYADWNINMGRYPIFNNISYSNNGVQKFSFNDDITSPDGKKLIEYIRKHEKKVYNSYTQGLEEIKRIINKNNDNNYINPAFMSKQYYIKDFKK